MLCDNMISVAIRRYGKSMFYLVSWLIPPTPPTLQPSDNLYLPLLPVHKVNGIYIMKHT
jgi:hypothetical protein